MIKIGANRIGDKNWPIKPEVPRYELNLPRNDNGTTFPIHTMTVGRISPWLTPKRTNDPAMICPLVAWDMEAKAVVHNNTATVMIVRYER